MEPTYVRHVESVRAVAAHNGCSRGVAFQTDAARVAVFRVPAGACIAPHRHSVNWDLFQGIQGHGSVATIDGARTEEFDILPGSLLAMPPGTTHTVTNLAQEDFVFALTQMPFDQYDYVAEEAGE